MKAFIFSIATRFMGILPPLVIALVTLLSNPNLHKKKQQTIAQNHQMLFTKINNSSPLRIHSL
jgi:hypothetical protein